jgi:hypothetical protein
MKLDVASPMRLPSAGLDVGGYERTTPSVDFDHTMRSVVNRTGEGLAEEIRGLTGTPNSVMGVSMMALFPLTFASNIFVAGGDRRFQPDHPPGDGGARPDARNGDARTDRLGAPSYSRPIHVPPLDR